MTHRAARTRRPVGLLLAAALGAACCAALAGPTASAAQPPAPPQLQGALIAGVPGEMLAGPGGTPVQGLVQAMLTNGTVQSVDQSDAAVAAGSDLPGALGTAVAVGDFDADGFPDLAIGSPDEPTGGAVRIVPGSATGLDAGATVRLTQTGVIPGVSEAGDRFGAALTVGDFDDDGHDDLVVGVPGEDLGTIANAGAIVVVRGGSAGLDPATATAFSQNGVVAGVPETGDGFGTTLVAGDFDGDGHDDLAVGVPDEDLGDLADAGLVTVLSGGPSGIVAGATAFSQRGPIKGTPEAGDRFGASLAAGDFQGDGRDDLVVGVPDESIEDTVQAGMIHVLFGGANGPVAGPTYLTQSGPTPGTPEAGDRFGFALAVGDFNGDLRSDLAIGAPGEDLGDVADVGLVQLMTGDTDDGLVLGPHRTLWPNAGLEYGWALAAGAMNSDTYDDLAIGIPGSSWTAADGGTVDVVYGSTSGPSLHVTRDFEQGREGFDEPEAGDRFGSVLAVMAVAATPEASGPRFEAGTELLGLSSTGSVGFVDVDADGDPDLLETRWGLVWMHENDGTGHFADLGQPLDDPAHMLAPYGFAAADIDGDSDIDLFAPGGAPAPGFLYRNDGSGGFEATDLELPASGFHADFADVDGDGDMDLAEPAFHPDGSRVHLNDGTGSFTDSGATLPGSVLGAVFEDVDDDGDPDLLLYGNPTHLLVNDGTGSFSDSGELAELFSVDVWAVAFGDIDGDGDPDLSIGAQIYTNDGNGVFSDSNQVLGDGSRIFDMALADIDDDGDLDLVHANRDVPHRLWLNDGAGTFTATTEPLGAGVYQPKVATADIDADGDIDLVFGDFQRTLRIWRNTTVE